MSEIGERPGRKKREIKPGAIIFNPYKPPKEAPPPGCRWVPEEVHVDKGYVISWRAEEVKAKEADIPESPMYPTTKPPRDDTPMGGVPKGDQD